MATTTVVENVTTAITDAIGRSVTALFDSTVTGSESSTWANTAGITSNLVHATTHVYDTYNVFIHPHWKQFPVVSPGWHYLIGVYITIVGITGILGNSLVIYIFTQERSLRTPSNMLIVNLAISDLTFSVVNGFPLLSLSAFNTKWMFGQAACEFYGLIGGIFGLMSINTMAAIAIDRYNAIARPLQVAKNMTKKKSFYMIVFVWLYSLLLSVPPICGWGRYIPEGFQTSCTFDYLTRTDNNRSYIVFMYIGGFVAPLFIIAVAYVLIIKAIRKHQAEMKRTAKKLNAEMRSNQDKQKMEIKVAKIAITILILYLLSWTPYATVALIGQFGKASFVTPFWSEIPVMFAKASAMHNPVVYALSHPKFRTAVHSRMPWLLCCFKPDGTASPGASRASSTFKDRAGSKRSISSVSSGVSNMSDSLYADMEFRLRKLEETTQGKPTVTAVNRQKSILRSRSVDDTDDIQTGKIISDLTQALIEIATRDKLHAQGIQPVYLPTEILKSKQNNSNTGQKAVGGEESVFVLDSSTLPGLATYLAKFSKLNGKTGVSNLAMDLSPESKKDADMSLGARPKTQTHGDEELQCDEAQL